jgi:branched-subunit amino acid aminotransferase/4-amino-4-deoxychorismate lyase
MKQGSVQWRDGAFVADGELPPQDGAPAPFETMGAVGETLPLWPRHRARLEAALRQRGLPVPVPEDLPAVAAGLLRRNRHPGGVVRLALWRDGDRSGFLVATRRRGPPGPVRVLPCVARRRDGAPADLKCAPRAFLDAVLAEARDGGADDGIALGDDGALLETALGNLWLLRDGVWCTPPLDGRVLPGIARAIVLERAAAAGLPVAERRLDLGDLHGARALVVTNAVHGPRSAALPEATVAILDARFAAIWASALCVTEVP